MQETSTTAPPPPAAKESPRYHASLNVDALLLWMCVHDHARAEGVANPLPGSRLGAQRVLAGARSCATTSTPGRPCGSTRAFYISRAATRCTHKWLQSRLVCTHTRKEWRQTSANEPKPPRARMRRPASARTPAAVAPASSRASPRLRCWSTFHPQVPRARGPRLLGAHTRASSRGRGGWGRPGSVCAREAAGDQAGADQDAAAGEGARVSARARSGWR